MNQNEPLTMDKANRLLENLHQTQQKILFTNQNAYMLPLASIIPTLKNTCQEIATLIHCERVELWLFNDERTKLQVEVFYDSRKDIEWVEDTIVKDRVPEYFEAMLDKRTLAVDNIARSKVMRNLNEQLSKEYDSLTSMLDASIVLSWGVGGVLCCLSEEERHWSPIERHVVASVADMLALILDRSYRSEAEKHIYKLAFTDTLTGLNNEHAFRQKVTEQLEYFAGNKLGVFLYITLDQYSDIRGALGHDTSEAVIKEVAMRLKETFPNQVTMARIGFDHFVIFSPFEFTQEEASVYIQDLAQAINKPMTIYEKEIYITFSYGASFFPTQVNNVKDGIQAAQIALAHAGEQSSRRAKGIYRSEMFDKVNDNLMSEINLRKALDEKQFTLFYQPQVVCETGEIYGFEALIRWNHPIKGIISPGSFIQLAESTGMIKIIGEWVINNAFQQLATWKENGLGQFSISVNLSGDHFMDESLPGFLLNCINRYRVSPKRLILEITENIALEGLKAVKERIIHLNQLGFSISIDDFGTGYSAFVYLQQLPVQEIKIDRQFIQNISKEKNGAPIVETIVQLGKVMGIKTIAEGVETLEEWETLKQIGCHHIQGFYFSKPLAIEKLDHLIKANVFLP